MAPEPTQIPGEVLACNPTVPTETLVEEVNRIFHRYEAPLYNQRHGEILEDLPALWSEMLSFFQSMTENRKLSILNFGCGSGFEAGQILKQLPSESITRYTCYDLSQEMLDECKRAIGNELTFVEWKHSLEELQAGDQAYNVLVTNSLLHHLPDPAGTLERLGALLSDDAIWLCGHEPSARYYMNEACTDVLESYKQYRKRSRWFDVPAIARRIQRMVFRSSDPYYMAAREAFEQNLFATMPSRRAIVRLVDFHVPHSVEEIKNGRGFDFRNPNFFPDGQWNLAWNKTYRFLGPFAEQEAPRSVQEQCTQLERQHPDDGAVFSAIWSRQPS